MQSKYFLLVKLIKNIRHEENYLTHQSPRRYYENYACGDLIKNSYFYFIFFAFAI